MKKFRVKKIDLSAILSLIKELENGLFSSVQKGKNRGFSFKRRASGFTMVEILTVLALITLISAVMFANYRQGNQQFVLESDAYLFAQDLRKAQEMALSLREITGQEPAGYGVFIRENDLGYKLYADTVVPANAKYDALDYTIQDVSFSRNVYVKSVATGQLSVNYAPPEPITVITDLGGQVAEATVTLGMQGSEKTKKIVVTRGGIIYVQ
jgi:prepilin-type N-terminal cleavage/methylation domain-containing protein